MGRGREMAERLMGTCDSVGDEMDDFTPEELEEFDSTVFECACGWWCDVGEMADDGEHCQDCVGNDDEEEEEEDESGERP